MSQTYGIEAHSDQPEAGARSGQEAPPARYLILIDSASEGRRVARLLLASHEAVAEFDSSAPEVQLMTKGLATQRGGQGAAWDSALGGHSAAERQAAEIYTLDA